MIWTRGTGSVGIIAWATFTTVDETIVLAGEITTEKPGVHVTALDPGMVTSVNVQMHQRVNAGEVLLTYNDDETDKRLKSQLSQKELEATTSKQTSSIYDVNRLNRDLFLTVTSWNSRNLSRGAIEETQKKGRNQ